MSLRPKTLAEALEKEKIARERRHKRFLKRRELGLGPTKEVVIQQLDHITSLLVRRRDRAIHGGYCIVCMAKQRLGLLDRKPQPIELAYHILPRGDGLIHFELRAIVGGCHLCNYGELHSRSRASLRDRYKEIHIEIVGYEVYEELERLAGEESHYTTADLIAMRDERKSQLEGRV